MRLNRKGLKKPMDSGFGDAAGPVPPPEPSSAVAAFGFATKYALTKSATLPILDRARAAGTQFIIKTLHTPIEETPPPFPDGRWGPLQAAGDFGVADAFRRPEK